MPTLTLNVTPATPAVSFVVSITDADGAAVNPSTAYGAYEAAFSHDKATPVTDGTDTLLVTGTATSTTVTFAFSEAETALLAAREPQYLTVTSAASGGGLGPSETYEVAYADLPAEAGATAQTASVAWTLDASSAVASTVFAGPAGSDAAVTAASVRALGFFDTTNDGSGSGLDADTVDGVEAAAFATKAANLSDLASAATARTNLSAVGSVTAGITGADAVTNVVSLTQAEYDAIASPDAATLYVITA